MRLKDADELQPRMVNYFSTFHSGVLAEVINDFFDNTPTINAVPVRYGHWVRVVDNKGVHFICPYCGEWEYHQLQKYCGECGAKMDEGKKDD